MPHVSSRRLSACFIFSHVYAILKRPRTPEFIVVEVSTDVVVVITACIVFFFCLFGISVLVTYVCGIYVYVIPIYVEWKYKERRGQK